MRLFIVDDCNDSWDAKMEFFIYGGIVVPESEAKTLAEGLLALKKEAGVAKERPVKWTNNKWNGEEPLDPEIHADLKEKILALVAASGIKIIVCASPQTFFHRGAVKKNGEVKMVIDAETLKRTQKYGLNDSLGKFNTFLEQEGELGFVLADKFVDSIKGEMDGHCFTLFPTHGQIIHPVVQVDNEESHLHQINDVVLGAIYFSLREMEHNFLPVIRDNFWMTTPGEYPSILHKGFTIFPLMAKYPHIQQSKKNLQDKLLRLISAV